MSLRVDVTLQTFAGARYALADLANLMSLRAIAIAESGMLNLTQLYLLFPIIFILFEVEVGACQDGRGRRMSVEVGACQDGRGW